MTDALEDRTIAKISFRLERGLFRHQRRDRGFDRPGPASREGRGAVGGGVRHLRVDARLLDPAHLLSFRRRRGRWDRHDQFDRQPGGFVGPYVMGWTRDATGTYVAGLISLSAACLMSIGIVLAMRDDESIEARRRPAQV